MGIYLGFCFNAGAPAVEAFIEKVSRRSNFEYGRARMFGCVGWRCVPRLSASCSPSIISLFSGWVLAVHSSSPFYFFAKTDAPSSATVANAVGANHSAFSLAGAGTVQTAKLWFCHCMLLAFAPTMFLTNSLLISLLRSLLPVNRVRGIWLRNDNGRIT
nr:MFS transporter [Klebsiella pneumoniae]